MRWGNVKISIALWMASALGSGRRGKLHSAPVQYNNNSFDMKEIENQKRRNKKRKGRGKL